MIIYVLINIAVVLGILGFDLYKHQFKQLKFSSVLIVIAINALINAIVIDKFNFITLSSIAFFIGWMGLQYYLNHQYYTFMISEYKSIALIFSIIVSCSLFITYGSSDQSIYMSVPYLAPTIFLIGASAIFLGTFSKGELGIFKFINKLKFPIMIGYMLIIMSIVLLTILTPFWYVFLVIYVLFGVYLAWQLKHAKLKQHLTHK
ncbi:MULTISPECIES: hypothetical protein [Staphylococcus]|uniref:hypothetical protein n=1 Tax=unclassified Staphylococcus TaxID=91994 RepID=UPI0008AA4CCF|nr:MULTISPECIES: hypothetical protein [unclassified Staphylococcus]OHR83932.1 hypothetical protein HMPREF3239_01190 [Staphylococcus sp. HMSC34C02]